MNGRLQMEQFKLIMGKNQECDVQDTEFRAEMGGVSTGMSPAELQLRQESVHDSEKNESGRFQWPVYSGDSVSSGSNPIDSPRNATALGKRKKGIFWSEEEKGLFAEGLKMYGRGNWKNISKHFVTSRTPTQVASHAQKFFLAEEKRRRRLGLSGLYHRQHQESSPASHFPIPSTSQIPPQQRGFEAPSIAPEYLLRIQFYGQQNQPNLISLPPCHSGQQALPAAQSSARVHPEALVSGHAYQLEYQHRLTLDEFQRRTSFVNLRSFASRSSAHQTTRHPDLDPTP